MNTKILFCVAFVLNACTPIHHTQMIEQPIGQQLVAGPGDLVIRVNKQRDLKNAFGRADIFGRKTDEGYSELRFAGVETDGTFVFYRRDVDIVTNETTMSRSVSSQNYGSTTTNVTRTSPNSAMATTTGTVTTVNPPSDYHVVVPPETIAIRIPSGSKSFPFENYKVEIVATTPTSFTYYLSQ